MIQKKILLISITILLVTLLIVPVTADVNHVDMDEMELETSMATYSNYIDIQEYHIKFKIIEEYSGTYAIELKNLIDMNNDGIINSSEINQFIETYINIKEDEFKEYIIINDGETELNLTSIEMNLGEIEGNINETDDNVLVTTDIQFEFVDSISTGENHIWIQGHPSIEEKQIILPEGFELISYHGLDDSETSTENERVLLTGGSGISSTVIDGKTTFEFATQVNVNKKAFYEHPYFLPILGLIFIILMGLAILSLKKDRREKKN
ncbi:hypothetical protein [Methanosalsum natronophilum]|uniref:hypothetical protein n=1 Tax=Methanosalsum natronophilum TaxID=768733 RepID=UPI002166DC55|nr:hypothetical protein [Methanosalsum natronophilum]MCS3924564.1 hypothetical protein [Methanosalsum natronophilum]